MGKKSKTNSSAGSNSNGAASAPKAGKAFSDPATAAPGRREPQVAGELGWGRLKRSLLGLALLGVFAMTDLLTLKEGFTVVAPDSTPLIAIVFFFAWLIWRRWASSGKQGYHPLIRTLGFVVLLAAGTAVLPFNSTVNMYEIPLLNGDECRAIVEAAAAAVASPGFVPTRFRFDPSTEVSLEDLSPEVKAMVTGAVTQRMIPFVGLQYGKVGAVAFEESGVYVEHYPAYHEPSPPPHLRHNQLAFRVELNPPECAYVGGGGVYLGSMHRTVTPGMGNVLILPAKLRHGSSELGPRSRSVLVGSLTVKGRGPWQRFVGIWRLWGLFSRQVRYVADKRLASSGVDTIPTFEPEREEALEMERAEESSPRENGDKLEF